MDEDEEEEEGEEMEDRLVGAWGYLDLAHY